MVLEYQNQHWWDFKNKDYIEYRKSLSEQYYSNKNSDKSIIIIHYQYFSQVVPVVDGNPTTQRLFLTYKGMLRVLFCMVGWGG